MQLQNERLIKKWEELRLEAYLPTPNDVWTIGWGHTKGVRPGDVITRTQAEQYFDQDVAWAVDTVNSSVKVSLTQNQFDALVSLTFNIGAGAFKRSTCLRRLNAGDYNGAAEALTWWNKQKGKVLRGLVRRRTEEKEYFLSETYEESVEKSITPEQETPLKSLSKSKEVIGGATAAVTGLLGAVGSLTAESQQILSVGLVVALVGFGVFVVYNRVKARKKGER